MAGFPSSCRRDAVGGGRVLARLPGHPSRLASLGAIGPHGLILSTCKGDGRQWAGAAWRRKITVQDGLQQLLDLGLLRPKLMKLLFDGRVHGRDRSHRCLQLRFDRGVMRGLGGRGWTRRLQHACRAKARPRTRRAARLPAVPRLPAARKCQPSVGGARAP
eukprot:7379727-Prymnesium_polylepis.2